MDWKVLNTEEQYQIAIGRVMEIFHVEEGTPEADELALLLVLVKDYEDRHVHIPAVDPIDAVKLKMEERGMKAKDLEHIIGSKGHVSSVLSGRRELTLNTARNYANTLTYRQRYSCGLSCLQTSYVFYKKNVNPTYVELTLGFVLQRLLPNEFITDLKTLFRHY